MQFWFVGIIPKHSRSKGFIAYLKAVIMTRILSWDMNSFFRIYFYTNLLISDQ